MDEVLREALCLSDPEAIFGKRVPPAEYVNGNLVTHGRQMREEAAGTGRDRSALTDGRSAGSAAVSGQVGGPCAGDSPSTWSI